MHSSVRRTVLDDWLPTALGASLLAWWDAEDRSSLTLSGAQVTTWTDVVGGRAPTQATADAKPLYSSASLNGRPGLTFDGIDDLLQLAGAHTLPLGAVPCEIWALVSQTALIGDTASRNIIDYGDAAGVANRRTRYVNNVGQQAARMQIGTGGTAVQADTTAAAFIGVHVVRGIATATGCSVSIDGNATTAETAGVPATADGFITIGATNGSGNKWLGVINNIAITTPLTATELVSMTAFQKMRGNL